MTVKHLEQYLAQKAIYIVGGSDSLQSFKQASDQVRFEDSKSYSGGNVERTWDLSVTKWEATAIVLAK